MKLVYAWFNFDDKNIFTRKGVTLTDEYLVNISRDLGGKQLILEISKNNEYISIFKNEVITEVSAIVGQNGAGKTTLLENISHNLMPLLPLNMEGYEDYDKYENEKNMGIRIYEENEELKVYHNLKDFHIVVNTDIKKVVIDLNKTKEFELDITYVFLTNSSLNSNTNSFYSTSDNKFSNISITPQEIKMFANDFYKKGITNKAIDKKNRFYNLQELLVSQKTDKDFQQMCDLIYFNILLEKRSFKTISGKVPTEVNIWCNTIQAIMQKSLRGRSNDDVISSKFKKWGRVISNNQWGDELTEINERLKLNWIFELDYIYEILDLEYIGTIDEKFKEVHNELAKVINKSQEDYIYTYYKTCYDEINEFIEIVKNFPEETNYLPMSDLAYKKNIKCVYSENKVGKKDYQEFTKFIKDKSKESYSFILKYLVVDSLGMSSGERAFLNLFSWLQLISFFVEAKNKIIEGDLRDNIILVIDEIDLYCHPEWQRIFIKNLIDELPNQFQGMNIQLILSTHSPIVLSDIPKSNTIYLKKTEKGVEIIDKNKIIETFGSNIFSLFNNSFFLKDKGVIGEYAANEINQLYSELSRLVDMNEENRRKARGEIDKVRSKFIIDRIGEPLIKNRMQVLYRQVFDNSDKKMKHIIDKVVSSSNIERLNVDEIAQLIHDELNKTTD